MGALNGSRSITHPGYPIMDEYRQINNNTRIRVHSGDLKKGKEVAHPLAGISIWYGDITGQDNYEYLPYTGCNVSLDILSAPTGKPIFGVAFNVDKGSTVTNFTGMAVLINYRVNQTQIVRYSHQNLRKDYPTIIASSSFTPTNNTGAMNVRNYPLGLGEEDPFMELTISSDPWWGDQISGIRAFPPNSNQCIGIGFIWVGNPDPGVHSIEIGYIGTYWDWEVTKTFL